MMQALVRLARRTSLLEAPLRSQQGGLVRALQTHQGGGESVAVVESIADAAKVVGESAGNDVADLPSPGAVPPAANGKSNKIYGRLSNCPKYAFKSDLLVYFEGCNLQPHQLLTIYDEKYRQRFIQIEFDNLESFRQAQRIIVRQGRLGGRYLKLDMETQRHDTDEIHNVVKDFRGQSLLMMQVPPEATGEDVDRFFQGYNLAAFSTRFLRVQNTPFKKGGSTPTSPANIERRALVKFTSPLEAFRALRSKHGQFCLNKSIDLRFIQ